MRVRKKPIEVEAVQFDGTLSGWERIRKELGAGPHFGIFANGQGLIRTLEGTMLASKFDWIIKGVRGEFYPCKPEVFHKSYEILESATEVDDA